MPQSVLMGDPAYFEIRSGANPHTRDRWGRRKRVDRSLARAQWERFRTLLGDLGVRVHVVEPVPGQPGLVFPANAGFRFGDAVYLSNLHPGRAGEREHYRSALDRIGLSVRQLPCPYRFEGEADFIPVGDPSGDPARRLFLFTYGRLEPARWALRRGWPPYRRVYGFRSDQRALAALQGIVGRVEILPLELIDEAHYHGDTVLCPFGPHQEFLLAYLGGLSQASADRLQERLGERVVRLSESDGRRFAANSFQVAAQRGGRRPAVLLMPEGLSPAAYEAVRARGVDPLPVNVSEFMEKGGGSVKCMLLNLDER